jgi:hypothetical protein
VVAGRTLQMVWKIPHHTFPWEDLSSNELLFRGAEHINGENMTEKERKRKKEEIHKENGK